MMMRNCLYGGLGVLLTLWVCGVAWGANETYSADVTRATYSTGTSINQFALDDDFDADTMSGDSVQIGSSAITDPLGVGAPLAWGLSTSDGVVESGGLTAGPDQKLRLEMTGNPIGEVYADRFLQIDPAYAAYADNQSSFSATFENFSIGLDTPDTAYGFGVGVDVPSQDLFFTVDAVWFTGEFEGEVFDHVLALGMFAELNDNDPFYEADLVVVPGPFDPSSTSVEVGISLAQRAGSTTFIGWYAINGGPHQNIDNAVLSGISVLSYPDSTPGIVFDMERVDAPGDYDDDGDIDDGDIDQFIGKLGTVVPPGDPDFDLNGDNLIGFADYAQHATMLLAWSNPGSGQSGHGTLLGDFNRDGVVGLLDLDTLGVQFNQPGGWALGDTNGDGVVGLLDLDTLGVNFGSDVLVTTPTVPEPTAAVLLGVGAAATVMRRRRKAG